MLLPQKYKSYKLYFFLLCSFSLIFSSITGYATEKQDSTDIWPKPQNGYKQVIIHLPSLANEDLYRIEIVPEKTMKVDCNQVMIHGQMDTKTLSGWGYDYYELNHISRPASTLMGCIPNTKQSKSIPIHTNLAFIQYNSKLPVIIYAPKDIHISYRVWSGGTLQQTNN